MCICTYSQLYAWRQIRLYNPIYKRERFSIQPLANHSSEPASSFTSPSFAFLLIFKRSGGNSRLFTLLFQWFSN